MCRQTFFAALLLLTGANLYAAEQEPCSQAYEQAVKNDDPPGVMWTDISDERESGCILGATDTTEIRQLYIDLRGAQHGVETAVKRAELFRRLLGEFDGIPSSPCPGDSTACMVGRHKQAIVAVRDLLMSGNPDRTDPRLSTNNWAVVVRDGSVLGSNLVLKTYLDKECTASVKSARCRAAFETAARIVRTSEATFQAVVAYNQPIIEANEQFLSMRDREWNAYFNDIAVQYPWELAANSAIFARQTKPEDRALFPRAPSSKLIVLHPSPGLEYAEVGDDHGSQAAVVVELIGYERWRWRGGVASTRFGVSLAASFADIPGADAVGYGLVLHLPFRNVTFGAIWRDGDAGDSINFVVNADLAKLIQQYKDVDVKDFLRLPPPVQP